MSLVGGGSYPSAENQSVYSTGPHDLAIWEGMWISKQSHRHPEWCNGFQARVANLYEWVWVSLGAPFIRLHATSKQKAL